MTHFTEDEIPPTSLRTIGREIHKRRAALFIIDKAEKGECPYAMYYKDQKVRRETRIRKQKEMKALLLEREIIKQTTPKKLWYPKHKKCGRYYRTGSEIKSQIILEAVKEGFNVKQIAGYFKITLAPIYRRIKAQKKLVELEKN